MSFSPSEKARMMFLMGASVFEDDGAIARAINSLDSKEAVARPIIQAVFDETTKIDCMISEAKDLAFASQDGSVKIDGGRTLGILQRHGRQAVGRLAGWIKVAPQRDVYSSSLPDSGGMYDGDPSQPRWDNELGVPMVP